MDLSKTSETSKTSFELYINGLNEFRRQYIHKVSNVLCQNPLKILSYCYLFDGIILIELVLDNLLIYLPDRRPWCNIYNRLYVSLPSDDDYKWPRNRSLCLERMYKNNLDHIYLNEKENRILHNVKESDVYKHKFVIKRFVGVNIRNFNVNNIDESNTYTYKASLPRDGDLLCDVYIIIQYKVKDKDNYYNEILNLIKDCFITIGNNKHKYDKFNDKHNHVMIHKRHGFIDQYLLGTVNTCSPIPIFTLNYHDVAINYTYEHNTAIKFISAIYTYIMLTGDYRRQILYDGSAFFGSEKTKCMWVVSGGMGAPIVWDDRTAHNLQYGGFIYKLPIKNSHVVDYKHELYKELEQSKISYSFVWG